MASRLVLRSCSSMESSHERTSSEIWSRIGLFDQARGRLASMGMTSVGSATTHASSPYARPYSTTVRPVEGSMSVTVSHRTATVMFRLLEPPPAR